MQMHGSHVRALPTTGRETSRDHSISQRHMAETAQDAKRKKGKIACLSDCPNSVSSLSKFHNGLKRGAERNREERSSPSAGKRSDRRSIAAIVPFPLGRV